jgi:hypothetical protein
MALALNSDGGYRFIGLPGPYSGGAVAEPGFDLVHARFETPVPLDEGLAAAVRHVKIAGRPAQAIAGFELRIPKPWPRQGFEEFNKGYVATLRSLGLEEGGLMPAGRTNVAPSAGAVSEPCVYAFSYTTPVSTPRRGFVVSGAAEEKAGDPASMLDSIMDQISARLNDLGASWDAATDIQWYGEEDVQSLVVERVLKRAGRAALHGIRWFPSRPPIDDLRLELDVRSTGMEFIVRSHG